MPQRTIPLDQLAVFVDLDGTLVEIVAQPHLVHVPEWLPPLLHEAAARLDGALALISGRRLEELDQLLGVDRLPAAGVHGAERRRADGRILRDRSAELPDWVRHDLKAFAREHKGVLMEDKSQSIALHFRQAPRAEAAVREKLGTICEDLGEQYVLQPGKMVLELRPEHTNKGSALREFMGEPPFAGRVPVFIGDDVTDEDGFRVVNQLDGFSVRVGHDQTATEARYSLRDVDAVHAWLDRLDCDLLN